MRSVRVSGLSVVGGFSVRYGSVPLAQYAVGWPLGRLNASADRLELSVRVPLGLVIPFVAIPTAEVLSVERRARRLGIATLRFHCSGDWSDRVAFSAPSGRIDALLGEFRSLGIDVAS